MRFRAAIHGTKGAANCGEGQGVCAGTGWHRKHLYRMLEQLTKAGMQLLGERVSTVTQDRPFVGRDKRLNQFGRCTPTIVAAKL